MHKTKKKIIQFFLSVILITATFSTYSSNVLADTPTSTKSRDISLIIDTSGSMDGTPMIETKKAASKFCSDVLSKSKNTRISIVTYADSTSTIAFTNQLDTLNTKINSIRAFGGTNMEAALTASDELFNKESDVKTTKAIVIMTDGGPNVGNVDTSANMKYPSDKYASAVYKTATSFNSKYDIYTLGFFHNLTDIQKALPTQLLKDIQTKGYYDVINSDDLKITFDDIAEEIVSDPPIIIIPGVMGSRLFLDEECETKTQVWEPKVTNMFGHIFVDYLGRNLDINKTLYTKPIENQVPLGIANREYGAQKSYKNLVDTVCEEFPNRSVYFFSYDFRKSNKESAALLKQFIDELSIDGKKVNKVDLICHSMGGLVASNYITLDSSKVDSVVTLGTPYEGAPKLVNAVLNLDVLTSEFKPEDSSVDSALGVFGLTKKVKAGFQGVAELTPTKSYFDKVGFESNKYNDKIGYDKYYEYCQTIFGAENYDNVVQEQSDIKTDNMNILTTLKKSYFGIGTGKRTISSLKFKDGNTLSKIDITDIYWTYVNILDTKSRTFLSCIPG